MKKRLGRAKKATSMFSNLRNTHTHTLLVYSDKACTTANTFTHHLFTKQSETCSATNKCIFNAILQRNKNEYLQVVNLKETHSNVSPTCET